MKRSVLVSLVGLFVLAGAVTASAAAPIKIGLNLEMTGGVAAYGQQGFEGIQTLQKMMKLEVLGRPVEFVLVDNKSDRVESANAAQRLIQRDHVAAIIGPMISGSMLAAGPVAEQAKVPIIGPSTTNPLTTQGRQFVFRACFIDPFQGQIAARFAYQQLGVRRAALLVDVAQDYAVGLGNFFAREFTKLGGQVVATQYMKTGDQDVSAQMTAIKAANPDILYMPNYYAEIAIAAVQARQLGLDVPILAGDGADAPELIQIGGKAVEGLMHTGFYHVKAFSNPLARQYVETYRKLYNKEPNAFGALAADSVLIILDAIKRAGSTSPEAIAKAMAQTKDLEVTTGTVTIEDGNAIKPVVIRKLVNGQWEYLATVNP
ncbi:ABC transporter substrate-binding protein [Carboxydochorda subterranea]|uniref:ABC transporter substrate-binding protein n=1 Tax=Carboxydichorda subterranea TaxID=3109565 RepID=A0ABZ1BVH8_9FIRM|nr:ABC transporter substrate-binding protein [Limnochorda sp. L945t]WRP16505.1 ABC transporter substrate-binding protein [Limnochorda sp. L945t]